MALPALSSHMLVPYALFVDCLGISLDLTRTLAYLIVFPAKGRNGFVLRRLNDVACRNAGLPQRAWE